MKEREYLYVDPFTTTPQEASDKLREHLYKTAKKAEELRRDVIYMEELYSVIRMLSGL